MAAPVALEEAEDAAEDAEPPPALVALARCDDAELATEAAEDCAEEAAPEAADEAD